MKIINNNNRGSREPLTSEDRTKLYLQIVRVCLDANADSPIDLALRSDNRTNLRELLFMIRKPGLILKLMYKDKDDGNIEKKLAGEEYEIICALESFINNFQNNYGPIEDGGIFDITTISRDAFMNFVWNRFDITKPIAYDEDKAIASREFWRSRSEKVANDSYMDKNEKERTMEIHASLSSDEMTRYNAQRISVKVVDAPSPIDDAYLTWEEINWNNYPPRSEDQDESVCTGRLPQLHTICSVQTTD
jgi:hypothetical protein